MNVTPGRLAAAGGVLTALGITLIMAAARQQGIADTQVFYEGRKKPCGCPEHDAEDIATASAAMNGGEPADFPSPEDLEDAMAEAERATPVGAPRKVAAEMTEEERGAALADVTDEELDAFLSEPLPVEESTGQPRDPKTGRLLPRPKPSSNGTEAGADLPEREAGITGLPPRPRPEDRAERPDPIPASTGLPPRPRPERPPNAPSMGAAT